MPGNENDSRTVRTKKLIRSSFTQLANKKSIDKITVRELTSCAGINRGTFYIHYRDIADLTENLENELYNELSRLLSKIDAKDILENPIKILESFCVFIHGNADVFEVLISENGDAAFALKFSSILNDKFLALFLEIDPNMDRKIYELSYEYCKMGVLGLIHCWLSSHPERTPRQIAELWLALISKGITGFERKVYNR